MRTGAEQQLVAGIGTSRGNERIFAAHEVLRYAAVRAVTNRRDLVDEWKFRIGYECAIREIAEADAAEENRVHLARRRRIRAEVSRRVPVHALFESGWVRRVSHGRRTVAGDVHGNCPNAIAWREYTAQCRP